MLTLPHVPSRLLVVALPAILVIYYLNQTFAAHRKFLADHNNTTTRQLAWSLQQLDTGGVVAGLWRASSTATVRLGIALTLLLATMAFFPATFSNTDILNETQIQRTIEEHASK